MKVSILVPVYKVPYVYLKRCIESMINQTLKDIEIIIVDDGSPDKCGEICDEFARNDSRIIVIHQENKGLASARNTAFYKAKGEYVMFLDGDDYIELDTCEKAYATAKKNNYEVVFWDVIAEYKNTSIYNKSFTGDSVELLDNECKLLQERVLDFNGKIAQVFAKLMNRQFLLDYTIIHEDNLKQGAEGFIFNIKLFEYANRCFYINKGFNHWVFNENSISHTASMENNIMIVRCFEFIENYILLNSDSTNLIDKVYTRLLYVIVTTAITGCFNPSNPQSYAEKKRSFEKFINEPIIIKSLSCGDYLSLDMKRRIVLYLIKHKCYRTISILGRIRKKSLSLR